MILARKTGNWRRTAKLTDKHLYNCTKCDRAWEYSIMIFQNMEKKKKFVKIAIRELNNVYFRHTRNFN